ncbi:class I SAM-dependent methyltransferase [Prochlorococcus sp. MIT 1300]|uniref:class I SAM-dependent methyltransferase n=1 Tax=Prochlorococcus sp. MIT 1300 TaxID=3096218 RepID=UPI002A7607F3|nr:class I SAM-dependent methyltransferase [Prochlorococcus sp. MIT 1300]
MTIPSFDLSKKIDSMVSAFYDEFPYPPDGLVDGPPPGFNWRWSFEDVYSSCTGLSPANVGALKPLRILDAGCGSGVSTDYLAHQNPGSEILAIDISPGTLDVARKRLKRSGGDAKARVRIKNCSLLKVEHEESFDYINSVGVLHHLPDPKEGLKALAKLLKPGGIIHLFLYASHGRKEIQSIQRALSLLGADHGGEGVRLGRELFATLPVNNLLRRSHEQRWQDLELVDANFADMYLHPMEKSFVLSELFQLVDFANLKFLGFSDPATWDISRLLNGNLLERARSLTRISQWQLIEYLDPEINHFEFFLSKGPLPQKNWNDDSSILSSYGKLSKCIWGWPNKNLLDCNLNRLVLTDDEFELLKAIEILSSSVPLGALPLGWKSSRIACTARTLQEKQVLLISLLPNPPT